MNTPKAAPVAVEAAAKLIYETWTGDPQFTPWQEGGNSVKQDAARRVARQVGAALGMIAVFESRLQQRAKRSRPQSAGGWEMSDRCPYCSFSPESQSDYCDEHRPKVSHPMTTKPVTDAEVRAAVYASRVMDDNGAQLPANCLREMRRALEQFAQSRAVEVVGAVPVTDEQADEIANACYHELLVTTTYNGGMGGQTWDRALVRAAMAACTAPPSTAPKAQEAALQKLADLSHELGLEPLASQPKAPAPVLVAQGEAKPIGEVWVGSAHRDGFAIYWDEDHTFTDGIHKLYATPQVEVVKDSVQSMDGRDAERDSFHSDSGDRDRVQGPLTDDRIMCIVRYSTAGSMAVPRSEWIAFARCLLREVEAAHGITEPAPRPDAPTSQINPGSAPREDGHG